MRIAVISTMLGQPWTGSEELWADMVEVALQQNHEVDISLWHWPSTPQRVTNLHKEGANVMFRRRPNKLKTLYRMAGQRIPLPWPKRISAFREVFRHRPDVICLSHGWVYEFRDNPDLLKRLYDSDIPLVVVNQANIETTIDENMRRDTHKFFDRATKVAFVSMGNLKAAERQLAREIPHGVVLRNPVNLPDMSLVPWPVTELHGPWNMACVGRLECGHKSQDVLLEAFSAPQWRDRNWRLRFFGGGQEKAYIEALIRHYQLSDHVDFGGHVPDVRTIWADHHLMVLPSRTEGTPLAMVESMLCGRAALVSGVAGFPEWIDEGQTGFIAEAPSAASIGAALERAWQQRASWREMGVAAHEAACRKYDPAAGKSLLHLLRDAAGLKSDFAAKETEVTE